MIEFADTYDRATAVHSPTHQERHAALIIAQAKVQQKQDRILNAAQAAEAKEAAIITAQTSQVDLQKLIGTALAKQMKQFTKLTN
jgi:hypothetical protein